MQSVVIVSYSRTPMGSFKGKLSNFSASELGGFAIRSALDKISLDGAKVDEVFMGSALQGGQGQGPARQAAVLAGMPYSVPCTTINRVCSSGMKAVTLGAQTIACGDAEIVVAGGMESMSNCPNYVNSDKKSGDDDDKLDSIVNGVVNDGVTDPFLNKHMGLCAEDTAEELGITRSDQDEYAMRSYELAENAFRNGFYREEIVGVDIDNRCTIPVRLQGTNEGNVLWEDEGYKKVIPQKVPKLRPAFKPGGTITAANASTLSDGAAAIVLMSKSCAERMNLEPVAEILSYADAAQDPNSFSTSPRLAIEKALRKVKKCVSDVDLFELNEAFSAVLLANLRLLKIKLDRVNTSGGAVSLGHPLGCSGTRILCTLLTGLSKLSSGSAPQAVANVEGCADAQACSHVAGKLGVAAICNGGGGASAILVRNVVRSGNCAIL